MDRLPFVLFISRSDVGDLDIIEAESQQHAGGLHKHGQPDPIEQLFAFLIAHSLIPGRQDHGDHGYAQALVVNIEHHVNAVRPETLKDLQQFIFVLQGLPAHKDRVGIMQFKVCAL